MGGVRDILTKSKDVEKILNSCSSKICPKNPSFETGDFVFLFFTTTKSWPMFSTGNSSDEIFSPIGEIYCSV